LPLTTELKPYAAIHSDGTLAGQRIYRASLDAADAIRDAEMWRKSLIGA
jgi:hypothetical protein